MPLRIVVLGAGAIGSVVGAHLAEQGHQVGLLGRSPYVEHVRAEGVRLREGNDIRTIRKIHVSAWLGELVDAMDGFDLAIIATKAYDTEEICGALKPYAGGLPVLVLQNGVGGEALASEILGPAGIISGVATLVVATEDMGSFVVRNQKGGVCVAPTLPEQQDVSRLLSLFAEAGFSCAAYPDYRSMKWSKLLLNMLANAVPAILGLTPAQVYAHRGLFALERSALMEALQMMRRAGIPTVQLPGYPARTLARFMRLAPQFIAQPVMGSRVVSGRAGKPPSLQLDLEQGKNRSEVTFLNGAVVRQGAKDEVPTPANRAITETLEELARGDISRDDYSGHPEALLNRARLLGWKG